MAFGMEIDMTDNTQPDSGRIITSSDILLHDAKTALMYEELRAAIDGGHESMTHADALAEIAAIRAENAALQQGYDAARLEIEHLRGVTKSKLLAQPVAWMVYLPSIDTQHLYYSQEDMGYVDDVTNHADAEVTPLYEMAAPKAEVAPAGEYPAITTEFINKHAHPSQAAKLCRADWSGKDESSVETVHPEVIKLLHAYVDADRVMRAQPAPAAVAPNWTDAANWLRNNYQDYPNIASLCEGMIAASPFATSTGTPPINWENVMPGGKYTDKWESSRVADYNRGWNDYRKESHKKLKELTTPQPTQAQAGAVPLTDEQIQEAILPINPHGMGYFLRIARAIERAHGIGIKGGLHGAE